MTTFSASFSEAPASPQSEREALQRLDALARFLDSAFRVPILGTRIGADALLNLIPGAGVLFAKSLSAWLIWEAARLGVPKTVLARMLANLGIDFAISVVPVAGWVGDVFFRANLRNMDLLRRHLESRSTAYRRETRRTAGVPLTIEGEWVREPGR